MTVNSRWLEKPRRGGDSARGRRKGMGAGRRRWRADLLSSDGQVSLNLWSLTALSNIVSDIDTDSNSLLHLYSTSDIGGICDSSGIYREGDGGDRPLQSTFIDPLQACNRLHRLLL